MDTVTAFGIGGLAIVAAATVVWMVRFADPARFPRILAAIVGVMAIQFGAAETGLLKEWRSTPPVIAPLMLITFALTVVLAFSRTGDLMVRTLPVAILIGFQVFRLPLELVMHRAAARGIMPPQMSYSGNNFDILTGITALPVAWLARRGNRPFILLWNVMGSVLLLAIIVIAVISFPSIAAFGPDKLNTWVADPPYVWLPGVLVPCALLGHLLLWRRYIGK